VVGQFLAAVRHSGRAVRLEEADELGASVARVARGPPGQAEGVAVALVEGRDVVGGEFVRVLRGQVGDEGLEGHGGGNVRGRELAGGGGDERETGDEGVIGVAETDRCGTADHRDGAVCGVALGLALRAAAGEKR
jgi:hypothetical protein